MNDTVDTLPRFVAPIENVTVAVGRDARLSCLVENLNNYKPAAMARVPLAAAAAAFALFLGVASGARITGRTPYYLAYPGGVSLTIRGEGFSEDQFSQFDPSLGNRVSLVNEEDEIPCVVIEYLTNANSITCTTGPRTRPSAPTEYQIVVYSDGVRADGGGNVKYVSWLAPKIQTVTPHWSVPGQMVTMTGWLQTNRYYQLDLQDPLEDNPDNGNVLTKVYLGTAKCEMLDENEQLLGTFTSNQLTCRSLAKYPAPMNASLYVNWRGSIQMDRYKLFVDSQDELYQAHTYPAITNVSPSTGSEYGGTLLTIDGLGFNPNQGRTKVQVGGVECTVEEVTDTQVRCRTPHDGLIKKPGAGERGVLVELYKGETMTDSEFWDEAKWATLDSAHAGYESFTSDAAFLSFPLTISENTMGRIRALFHAPHDGQYMILGSAGNKASVRVTADGNPENAAYDQPVALTKGTPAYVEVRFRADANTNVLIRVKDFNSRYVSSQTFRAVNDRHRVKMDISQVWEKQALVITGSPTPATLFMNGITSAPVDISDSALVREQLLDMTEQKCEREFTGLNVLHHTDFEDGSKPPGILGSFIDDVAPYCGRKMFRLRSSDPRVYRETNEDLMVNANTHRYLCFAVSGKLQTWMAINFKWKDNNGRQRDDTFWFERSFPQSGWVYHCEDFQQVMAESWAASQYTAGAKLLVKNIVLPKPAGPTDSVYIDEVVFVSDAAAVSQTRPSALKQQGILVEDVEVQDETETGYSLRFVSTNCQTGMPLLGVLEGEPDNSLIDILSSSQAYTFTVGEGTVAVSRVDTATAPLAGTWDMSVLGREVKNIPADIHEAVLESYLESALGTEIRVSYSGSCRNYNYYIEFQSDPGLKELAVVDDSNLVFDGDVTVAVYRDWEGMIWHDPLAADFMTAYRDAPHVTAWVNGYSAACHTDCAYTYVNRDDEIQHTGSSISAPNFEDPVIIEAYGTGFTSNDLSDYSSSLGDVACSVTAVDNTQAEHNVMVSCDILVAGIHPFNLGMQPYGLFSYGATVTLSPIVTSLSIEEGPVTGYYPITVYGKGFPADAADWGTESTYIQIGTKKCEVIAGGPTEVTCMAPSAESAEMVSVTVSVKNAASSTAFTYTEVTEVPTISSLSLASLSVYGGEELLITGSVFGSGTGMVKVGSESCEVVTWSAESVTCNTPSLAPGTYTVSLITDGLGMAETSVDYVFSITSTSLLKGSVKGGTTVMLKGQGFGSDCSRLKVLLGQDSDCDGIVCDNESLTCVTRVIPKTYEITNAGFNSESSVLWSPRVLDIKEGDTVIWKWNKLSENTQLKFSVCQVPNPMANCEDDDGTGFNSGAPTESGQFSFTFHNHGIYYFAGQPASTEGLIMRGQINVVRPQTEALKMTVLLGEQEATVNLSGAQESIDTSCSANQAPVPDCTVPEPTIPDDGNLYFLTHTCYTPVITRMYTDSFDVIPGLSGIQLREGIDFHVEGSGFNDETNSQCKTKVHIGSSACAVSLSSSGVVTCTPDMEDLGVSYYPVVVNVFGNGIAAMDLSDYNSEGRVVVVPYVSSMSPTEGSLAGGTLVTITGSGLQGVSADPVVLLGGKVCSLQDVSPTSVTCLSPASPTPIPAPLTVTILGIQAILAEGLPSFIHSEALTPQLTGIEVNGETVTLSGENLGSDTDKLTVTLKRQTVLRQEQDIEEEEEEEEVEEDEMLEIDGDYIEDYVDDEEMEHMVSGYLDEEEMSTAEAVRMEKGKRHSRRTPKLSLPHISEVPEEFWGTFTGTGAKTFKETVVMGAWRTIGGISRKFKMDNDSDDDNLVPKRKKRSVDDLPSEYECEVTVVTSTEATCIVSGLPAGSYTAEVSLDGAGFALQNEVTATADPVVSSISPTSGSINGGVLLTIHGSGFIVGDTSVMVGDSQCPVVDITPGTVTCLVASGTDGSAMAVVVSVTGSSDITAASSFTYSSAVTPTLDSVTPASISGGGATLTLTGSNFKQGDIDPEVAVGDASCTVTSATDINIICMAPELAGATYNVVVKEANYGDSNAASIVYETGVDATVYEGGFGGSQITITGFGFDPAGGTTVTVCDNSCEIVGTPIATEISCIVPPEPFTGEDKTCEIKITQPGGNVNTDLSYQYLAAKTTSISSISPKRGGTAGGTTLTIEGTGFESTGNVVTIGGSSCEVLTESSTTITCRTSSHEGSEKYPVNVNVPNKGLALTDENGEFFYIDLWSSVFTWGNDPVPSEGQLVLVDEGKTVLIDESTPVLKMLLLDGGHVIFDSEATQELVFRAEYILIVGGGSLSIGSEEEPFPGEAVIELYGNTQSIELPIYGAKVMAVRDGTLDLHGTHVPITWTYLQTTASSGATSITLVDEVTWEAGNQIVIASTGLRFSRNENEVRTITSVSSDGHTIEFAEPLEFDHISITQTLAGQEVATRAEVGLLSRKVKIRGAINEDFTEEIEGCEDPFNPGQFATQTCFNGRYGDEIGSDQFGATVMLFGKYPDQNLVTGRIENVEVTEAGQAFQLGRYPLHFHLVGDVSSSYIRNCAVHRTYNRAITIHAANYLTVERNVVFNTMGHAIFTEDGVEQNNVIQYNLAIYTRTSSSLLNVDVTPASYWVVNPNNIVRHNAAAGGSHFGYWYRTERHPSGPSATNDYCPNNEVMGQFLNNTAHSFGRYGLWVFSMDGYHPRSGICRGSSLVAKWEYFTSWHCERGAEVVFGTNLQFHNFVALNNEHSGLEMVKMLGGNRVGDSPGIFNSLVACHSALGDDYCTAATSGIVAPKQYTFSISGVTFVNFDVAGSSALAGCSQCKPRQGGFRMQVEGLNFVDSPNRLEFLWESETIWLDEDGSLSGTAGASVVPWMDLLPTDSCTTAPELSVNDAVPGAVCSSDMKFLRYNIKGPNIEPPSLQGRDLFVTNANGQVTLPYKVKRLTTEGWMGILYAGDTYEWLFEGSAEITNLTYKAETRLVSPGDYYYVKRTLMQAPDFFGTTGEGQDSLLALPDPSTDFHGDYYWDSTNREMTYMVSYSEKEAKNLREFTIDAGSQRDIRFEVFRNAPTPPPVPTGRPDAVFYWSNKETWKEVPVGSGGHPTETEYDLPVEGDEIIIPQGMWLIVDTETPPLGRVYVYGTLEFDDTMDHYFEATILYIQGGTVVAGFSKSEPFTHQLEIQLRGSTDPDDPDNVEFPMPEGVPDVGWKAIGVFGTLKLHGVASAPSWHKLGATAEAGSNTVILATAPDASWLDKKVVVSTTSKEATESEVKTVVAVDGTTLTLDSPLEFEHLGVTHTFSDGTAVTLAAEVGLLSRNIVVRGSPTEDSFGGRIVVSRINQDGINYVGSIQLDGVWLDNMGQESFTDLDDPRYALAIFGLGTLDDDSSYITKSSFSTSYNVAVGVFGTSNLLVEDNVIYNAVDSGVRDENGSNMYKNNLITTVLFLGTYGDRFDTQNLNWYGAFHLDNAPNTVLEGNVVAGAEQAGYKTYGEICEDAQLWQDNEVHNTIFGVMSFKKSGMGEGCRRIHDFYAWRISDTGYYVQHHDSSLIENVISVDNPLGVNQLIRGPAALTHQFSDKSATVKTSVFVGASPSQTCTFQKSTSEILGFYSGKLWDGGVNSGNTAVLFGSFMSGANLAPKKKFSPTASYPALHGKTEIRDNKFISFESRSCGKNIALMANPGSEDAIHPVFVSGLSFVDTPEDNKVFIPRANVGSVNPSDCVDMDCDGHKKVVLKDTDGSLLGTADTTLISEAEYEWDGDPRRGVGDYRIPVALRQNDDGTQITAAEKFPNKGIVRSDICNLVASWQAWVCKTLKHFMMVIESMDTDTEVRRLSPIALIANPGTSGYVDLINGPMDRGWCFGYTCQERISTFYAVMASDQVYEMGMTSTPPQVMRFHPLTYSEEVVVLRIFFPKLQRYDVYVDGTYVAPTNIDPSTSSYQLLPEVSSNPEAFFPTISSPVGSNYLQRSAKLLHVVVGKSQLVTIKTMPMITLQSGLVVSNDEFYEENLLQNLVDLFGLSPENIRVTNIVPEDSRHGLTRAMRTFGVSAEIGGGPTADVEGTESAMGTPMLSYDELVVALSRAVSTYQEGSCDACASFGAENPITPPPAEAPEKATEEYGSVIIDGAELFSNQQQKEEEAALNKSMETVEFSKPNRAEMLAGVPNFVVVNTSFSQQPVVVVLDEQGKVVNDLGPLADPWTITAALTEKPAGAVLQGTTTIPYLEGAATFSDLTINLPGEGYRLGFSISYPADAPALSTALESTFSARTEIPMAVNVSLPEGLLIAEQPISLTVQLVDEDSGELLDGAIFQDQVIVGELLEKRGRGNFVLVKRFYEINSGSSEIPLEITVDEPVVRYKLLARVSIVPGEWYLEYKTPRLVVYPSGVNSPAEHVTKNVQLNLIRQKLVPGVEDQLEDEVFTWVMNAVPMLANDIVWGPITIPVKARKTMKADLTVVGPEEQVTAALNELCKKVRFTRPNVKVTYNCRQAQYAIRRLYVDGKFQRCRRSLSLEDATEVEMEDFQEDNLQVLNSTVTEAKVLRHKFNRG